MKQESSVVLHLILNVTEQYVSAMDNRSAARRDRSDMLLVLEHQRFYGSRRVVNRKGYQLRVTTEEIFTLSQCDRMRSNFPDLFESRARERYEIVRHVKNRFTGDLQFESS